MKKIRRLKIRVRTGRLLVAERKTDTTDDNRPPTEPQKCPLTAGGSQLCRNASDQIAFCSSSIRYKSNIQNYSGGLALISRLRPVSFRWNTNGERDLGFVAEEVAEVEPLMTTRNAQGEIEGIKYDRISAALVNAVNEQQTQIEQQQTQIKQQQTQINQQQKQLQSQQQQIDALKKLVCQSNSQTEICQEKEQ